MAYTPDAYDDTQPVSSVAASTLPLELRTIKSALIGRKTASETNATNIADLDTALQALAAAVAAGTRFALLTSTTEDTFTVPAGVSELLVIAIGGGQGGQGGGQRVRMRVTNSSTIAPNSGYTAFSTTSEARAPAGMDGTMFIGLLPVTAGQDYTYICGAGSDGTVANPTPDISQIVTIANSPGAFLGNWQSYQSLALTKGLREVTRNAKGNVLAEIYDLALIGLGTSRTTGNSVQTFTRQPFHAPLPGQALTFGAPASAGGNTRFGISANPNDPALLEVSGGGQEDTGLILTSFGQLGQFGAGGRGGINPNASSGASTSGERGSDGAILVMW